MQPNCTTVKIPSENEKENLEHFLEDINHVNFTQGWCCFEEGKIFGELFHRPRNTIQTFFVWKTSISTETIDLNATIFQPPIRLFETVPNLQRKAPLSMFGELLA